jgi:hypothetical protein
LQIVDCLVTSTLFWILVGAAFVAAELAMTMLIVRRCTRAKRNPGS